MSASAVAGRTKCIAVSHICGSACGETMIEFIPCTGKIGRAIDRASSSSTEVQNTGAAKPTRAMTVTK